MTNLTAQAVVPREQSYSIIPLTQSQVARVSTHRYHELACFKWYAKWDVRTGKFYAARNDYLPSGKRTTIRMHRQILGLKPGDTRFVDHQDLDTLNNVDENIRIATRTQNGCNRERLSNNKSGFKGVSRWSDGRSGWKAQITIAGKVVYLGTAKTKRQAANLYSVAAKLHHGAFARTD